MYGVEKRFKMQLLLGLKGSPLVGAGILNFVTPDLLDARAELFVGHLECYYKCPFWPNLVKEFQKVTIYAVF